MDDIYIWCGYLLGVIGCVVELYVVYYIENWSFGVYFEVCIVIELVVFMSCYDDSCDGFWIVIVYGCVEGLLIIDGQYVQQQGVWLCWFIFFEKLCGWGVGDVFLIEVICFCVECDFFLIYFCIFEGLYVVYNLYQCYGFVLVEECIGLYWGVKFNEQCYELLLQCVG